MNWASMILLGLLGLSIGFAGAIGLGCIIAILLDWLHRLDDQAADRRASSDRRDHIALCQEFERRGGHAVDWDAEFSDFLKEAGR